MDTEALELPEGAAEGPPIIANPQPCEIRHTNGKDFRVPQIGAWTYTEQGIFATGHWRDRATTEVDILIPYHRIDYITMDFDTLRNHLRLEAAKPDENPGA